MTVKIRQDKSGRWWIRIDWHQRRTSRLMPSQERAIEVAKKISDALDLYGERALEMIRRPAPMAKVRYRTPHSLRHTYASISLASGLPLAYVSKQLGHSNPAITLEIYCHWVPGSPVEKTCALDRLTEERIKHERNG